MDTSASKRQRGHGAQQMPGLLQADARGGAGLASVVARPHGEKHDAHQDRQQQRSARSRHPAPERQSPARSASPAWRRAGCRSGGSRRSKASAPAATGGPAALSLPASRGRTRSPGWRRQTISATALPCIAVVMAAATARAHSAATAKRSEPRRQHAAGHRGGDTHDEHAGREERDVALADAELGCEHPRGEQGEGDQGLQPRHGRERRRQSRRLRACRGGLSRYHGRHPREGERCRDCRCMRWT